MIFPNGMSEDERRYHALMVARDCTADLMKPDETLRAAELFHAFLSGRREQRAHNVQPIRRVNIKPADPTGY